MLENVGYTFDSIEDLLIFAEWLQDNFEDAEEFEEYLASNVPAILEADGSENIAILINLYNVMDDAEEDDVDSDDDESAWDEAIFWDIISNEYHHKDSNGSTIFDTN